MSGKSVPEGAERTAHLFHERVKAGIGARCFLERVEELEADCSRPVLAAVRFLILTESPVTA